MSMKSKLSKAGKKPQHFKVSDYLPKYLSQRSHTLRHYKVYPQGFLVGRYRDSSAYAVRRLGHKSFKHDVSVAGEAPVQLLAASIPWVASVHYRKSQPLSVASPRDSVEVQRLSSPRFRNSTSASPTPSTPNTPTPTPATPTTRETAPPQTLSLFNLLSTKSNSVDVSTLTEHISFIAFLDETLYGVAGTTFFSLPMQLGSKPNPAVSLIPLSAVLPSNYQCIDALADESDVYLLFKSRAQRSLQLWNAKNGKLLMEGTSINEENFLLTKVLPSGYLLASTAHHTYLWSSADYSSPVLTELATPLSALATEKEFTVTGDFVGGLRIVERESGRLVFEVEPQGKVGDDSSLLALTENRVSSLQLDGSFAVAGSSKGLNVWPLYSDSHQSVNVFNAGTVGAVIPDQGLYYIQSQENDPRGQSVWVVKSPVEKIRKRFLHEADLLTQLLESKYFRRALTMQFDEGTPVEVTTNLLKLSWNLGNTALFDVLRAAAARSLSDPELEKRWKFVLQASETFSTPHPPRWELSLSDTSPISLMLSEIVPRLADEFFRGRLTPFFQKIAGKSIDLRDEDTILSLMKELVNIITLHVSKYPPLLRHVFALVLRVYVRETKTEAERKKMTFIIIHRILFERYLCRILMTPGSLVKHWKPASPYAIAGLSHLSRTLGGIFVAQNRALPMVAAKLPKLFQYMSSPAVHLRIQKFVDRFVKYVPANRRGHVNRISTFRTSKSKIGDSVGRHTMFNADAIANSLIAKHPSVAAGVKRYQLNNEQAMQLSLPSYSPSFDCRNPEMCTLPTTSYVPEDNFYNTDRSVQLFSGSSKILALSRKEKRRGNYIALTAPFADYYAQPVEWLRHELPSHRFTVVVFFKGGWCPWCMEYMRGWSNFVNDITFKGGILIGAAALPQNKMDRIQQEWNLTYPLISDPSAELAESLGIQGEHFPWYQQIDPEHEAVTNPGVVVLDSEGLPVYFWRARSDQADRGVFERPKPKSVVSEINKLFSSHSPRSLSGSSTSRSSSSRSARSPPRSSPLSSSARSTSTRSSTHRSSSSESTST